jgi:hypothetical protein
MNAQLTKQTLLHHRRTAPRRAYSRRAWVSLLTLVRENNRFAESGGVSDGNRQQGFRPAFRDRQTGKVYPSRFADGRPSAIHLFDGLPCELVEQRDAQGKVIAVGASIEAGFVRGGRFYTRAQAADAIAASAAGLSEPI